MPNRKLIAVIAPLTLLVPFAAHAGSTDDTFVASVTVTDALAISCTDLNFGEAIRPGGYTGGASIRLSATDGTVTAEPGILHGGGASRAACTVSGVQGGDATIAMSATGATWNGTNLGVVGFHKAGQANFMGGSLIPSKASAIGNETIYIGGNVSIQSPAGWDAGVYSSDPITVTLTD